MPHLSPIMWTGIYIMIWFAFVFMLTSLEFTCNSVDR